MAKQGKVVDVQKALKLRKDGYTYQQISDHMGVPLSAVYSKVRGTGKTYCVSKPFRQSVSPDHLVENDGLLEAPATETPSEAAPDDELELIPLAAAKAIAYGKDPVRPPAWVHIPGSVAEAEKQFNDFIGYDGRPPAVPTDRPVKLSGEKKILLLNDIHAPYHDINAIKQAILEQAHDTDTLLLGGDLMDLFNVSRYDKFEVHYPLEEEFRSGKALLNYFSSIFPRIRIIPGNHDERWKKYLMTKRNLSPADIVAMNYLIREASGDPDMDITDPLYLLTRDLKNVEVVKPVRKDYARFSFFMQENDLIVSHAEKFSRVTGTAANTAMTWFQSYALPEGLVRPFRVFAQCHTHQASMNWSNFSIWTMECGCLCKTPDYAAGPKLMGAQRAPKLGYSVFYQDATGRTDMRRSRFIPIEG
jgi:hypothetical protein